MGGDGSFMAMGGDSTMGGDSSFMAMFRIVGFLAATWSATKVSQSLGISSIVLEVTTGVVLGPGVAGLISPSTPCEVSKYTDCGEPSDAAYMASLREMSDSELAMHHPALVAEHILAICHRSDYQEHLGNASERNSRTLHRPCDGPCEVAEAKLKLKKAMGELHALKAELNAILRVPISAQLPSATHAMRSGGGGAEVAELDAEPENSQETVNGTDGSHSSSDEEGLAGPENAQYDVNGTDCSNSSSGKEGRRLEGSVKYISYESCLVKTCAKEPNGECLRTPDMLTLIGHVGVALMLFQSGMHFDFEKARALKVGPWPYLVAVLGTFLPLAGGTGLAMAYGNKAFPDGIVAGTALAPTSVGMSLKLLVMTNMLDTNLGQSIMTAVFASLVISLILYQIVFSMGSEPVHSESVLVEFMHMVFPSFVPVLFMVFAVILAVFLWPPVLRDYMAPCVRLFARKSNSKSAIEDEALLFVMLLLLAGYAFFAHFCGTHLLLGCFVAGISFSCLGHDVFDAHRIWERQTKRFTKWMLRIFFACTVAFSIPVFELLSGDAVWKGFIMGIGPCITATVFSACFMGKSRWAIGWAMAGRAELAFLIAQQGLAHKMMDPKLFAIVLWALLWATIVTPIACHRTLIHAASLLEDEPGLHRFEIVAMNGPAPDLGALLADDAQFE